MNSSGPPRTVDIKQTKADMYGQPLGSDEGDVIARNIEEQAGSLWLCWYGHSTRRFWAITRQRHPWDGHIEASDALSLLRRIGEVDAYFDGPGRRPHGSWSAA